jgi:enoyl-CoA hydratase/carnithine racemase
MISQNSPREAPQACVLVKIQKQSGTIVLDRPQKRNAISRQMLAELQTALGDVHQQRGVRAVILTGAGKDFCAGTDLAELHQTSAEQDPQAQWLADTMAYQELIETMLRFPKPIIAAVNGCALGIGAGLVLACDVAIGTPETRFGFPETRRGLVAGIAAPLLGFRVGGSLAADLLLRGRLADADECRRLGIYSSVVGHDLLWAKANEIAREVAQGAAEAVSLTKRLLNETIGENLATLLAAGAAATATARTTAAAREGMAAFVEKREPDWP